MDISKSNRGNSKHWLDAAIHYAWNKIRKRAGIQDEQYMILEERLPLG
ncbi:hypothetical protein [Orientia tsutsugamushi]|uniref:Uncharacterized protein n=1 Tax=Orientia tsutsugamushi TaxID=784 RepID=A0A2U3QQP5_ORITS|nr:hypothetical protein [Orientia tsutsugamushi]KJV70943.1 hypothetical protein OTSUT76_3833 [Orientia tsutsugamushi str. UT76]KJV53826.1 hypothetical protein OTSKATO_1181 [Orientia tsutsugamushi str. Kato PP]KJV54878.1 hypothetical protein OTSKARP_0950 [Orientia tsutsugamushi str. Karp]KJV78063.1 hypothetical protein OTSUT76_2161 [Orientia tsutsugamushi str. UT76]KJV88526.1 hypothetical protein OTSUT76_1311 [Orientia tsutsugamushi str. UT76]